jgi:hypothetical protein
VISPRSYPRSRVSESQPSEESCKLNLESMAYSYPSSMVACERKIEVARRRRRQRRLADEGEIIVHNASPSTIPENESINHAHFEGDKLSIPLANTLETVLTSTMTPETPDWVGRIQSAPSTGSSILLSETTESFSSQEQQRQSLREGKQLRDAHPHQNAMRIPPSTPLSSSFNGSRRLKMSKSKDIASKPKPKLRKTSTAPSSCVTPKQTDVIDNVLMDRAFSIRQRLINFEMQELAVAAEKAAESGLEKFVGSASKFGGEETPPYRPKFVDDAEFVMSSIKENEGFITPLRQRYPFVNTRTHPMDYTPSYFSRKKIPVTKLRHVSEIVPSFKDIHNNIRIHLSREGVDVNLLPAEQTRLSLVKSDTEDTEREDVDDTLSQVHSVAASHTGSISSFSSYAVASLTSLRDLMTSPSISSYGRENSTATDGRLQTGLRTKKLHFETDTILDKKNDIKILPQSSIPFKSSVAESNSDSDDSSVEFYGRKSPAISTDASEVRHLSLSKSSSGLNAKQHAFQRLGSNAAGASVTFDTKRANDHTQIDSQNNAPEKSSMVIDQMNLTSPLSNLEIQPSSSSIRAQNKLTPMADFLSKIQNQFSLSSSADNQPSPKLMHEDNEYFLANFLYTCEDLDDADPNGGLLHLNLEVNPERHNDTFCLQGCGPNEMLSACDSATKYADLIFDWFSTKSKKSSKIIDPDEQSNPTWLKTWQTIDAEEKKRMRRVFTPPKLSAKNTVDHHESSTFCSPTESVNLGVECEDSILGCTESSQPLTCPDIQNNVRWRIQESNF